MNDLCTFIAKPSNQIYEYRLIHVWETKAAFNTIQIDVLFNEFLPVISHGYYDCSLEEFVERFPWEPWMINGTINQDLLFLVKKKLKL